MLIKSLILASAVLAGANAHASFKASFASHSVTIITQDGKPLPNIRVYYRVSATKIGTCRSAHNPFDWGHACPADLVVLEEKNFVLTDASGKATIPAVKVSDSSFSSREPILSIIPVGPQTPLKIESGKTYSCVLSLPINNWEAVDLKTEVVSLSEAQSQQMSGKNFIIKNRDSLHDMTEYYLRDAEAIVKREYLDSGDDSIRTNRCL